MLTAQFQYWDCKTRRPLGSAGVTVPGFGIQKQRLCVWASSDHGRTFRIVGGDCCQNGDDASLAQTPSSGTLLEAYMSNIGIGTGVPGLSLSRSTDNGRTWTDRLDVDKQVLQDRPWLVVESERNVLISFTTAPGNVFVIRSKDKGRSWSVARPVMVVPPELVLSLNGEPTYDVARREIVLSYAYSSSHAASDIGGAPGAINIIGVARSKDHGATWTNEVAARLPRGQGVLSLPTFTSDVRGHEYLAYDAAIGAHGVGTFLIRSSRDGSWSHPVRVDPPGGSAMEPSVRATGDGHVAVAYYHAGAGDARDVVRRWTTDVATSRDGAGTFTYASASNHVVYVGTESNASATLFDLLAIEIGRDGFVNVAWTDDGTTYPTDVKTQIEFARQAIGDPL